MQFVAPALDGIAVEKNSSGAYYLDLQIKEFPEISTKIVLLIGSYVIWTRVRVSSAGLCPKLGAGTGNVLNIYVYLILYIV